MEIYDNIENFLSMENTGALMIVGAWGSGKTYYIDNEVFKKLGEGENPRQCIRVSLFGVKDTCVTVSLVSLCHWGQVSDIR